MATRDSSIPNITNSTIVGFPTASVGSFNRLRVAELTTQYDQKQLHDNLPLFIDSELIGTATNTYSGTLSQSELATNASGDSAIMQTLQRTNYQSGKSKQIFWTVNKFGNGDNIEIVSYRSGTETARVARQDWVDPLDGTGASKIAHDFDQNTILCADFEWLGVGGILYCIVKNRSIIPFHFIDFTDTQGVYMTSPNQPLRWECRQDGASSYINRVGYFSSSIVSPWTATQDGFWLESTDAQGELNVICGSANTEGAINQLGKILSDNAGINDLQFNSAGTTYAGIGIRLKTTHLDSVIDILEFDYMGETNDRALWELRLNPTITGTFVYTDITNGSVQTSIGNQTAGAAPTVTGGTILDSGYVQQQGQIEAKIDSAIKLGSKLDGTRDEIVLCITPVSSGLDAYVSYTWREQS